jgi:hypothetical protein
MSAALLRTSGLRDNLPVFPIEAREMGEPGFLLFDLVVHGELFLWSVAFLHLENRVSAPIAERANIAVVPRTGQFAHFRVVTPRWRKPPCRSSIAIHGDITHCEIIRENKGA